ncbi:cytochrome c oxidase accessory protein CcoG [Psychroflexus maritimus]|uniref:Cytochrome c oxidase accessory protein CcoG n=1 Tax=Psychroflexus maritimus TaxID=2714865 RepID=A0A967AF90_9FLAO|nr:cytochrome c oxidase accessory protein CcoG [Psychroflexus maritimus]NGZ90670.1 cytochrome c oxidase accessory protein CcoG [Psychroflexus maritimus]
MQQDQDNFRDRIGTMDDDGKRAWVYPKKPSGKFYDYRKWVSYFLLTFLLLSPFIKINGNQFLMFNVLERRFNIFGFPFWPQDFYLFVISMIILVVFIALFTVAFGRIFCGWICPQTIFMEMVFRRIEYAIEGDRNKQRKLDKMEWNKEKITKRSIKWFIFALISFIISNVFLAYLIGSDRLIENITSKPSENLGTFIPLVIFTGVFYFVFAWFREQVCIIACPYGRMQSVLLDEKSVVVAYDHVRGEAENGRKKFRKNEDREALGHGDCIDCFQCVHVCPTGIDIRNGTQLECVNCTACIDECDHIMESINKPKGLIRYASEDNISKGKKFQLTARMKAYAAVLTILTGILVGLLFIRSDVEARILRLPGNLYETMNDGALRNVYTYKLVNKTTRQIDSLNFRLISHTGEVKLVKNDYESVPEQGMSEGSLFINVHPHELEGNKTKLKIGIYNRDELIETTTANFMGPRSFN